MAQGGRNREDGPFCLDPDIMCSMPPCACALAMARVPARRWGTREDVFRRLELARSRIDQSLDRPRLAGLAREASLSEFHFHRLFREAYGQTPQAYVRTRRLERALALLRGGMPANQVCAEVGFASVSSFSRAFRTRYGHPPGATLVGISKAGQPRPEPARADSRT